MSGRRSSQQQVEQWRRRLERYMRGEWTVGEFCRRERVSVATFYNWRRRLQADHETDAAGRTNPEQVNQRPQFVPVELVAAAGGAAAIQIELPGGAVVRMRSDCSSELVAAAVRAAWSESASEEEQAC